MGRTVNIGAQGFDKIRESGFFYVDKTGFIREWWDAGDDVTLICRPRRFGKTLNLSTVECFLSTAYAGRGEELFGGLDIWNDERFRGLQGTVPVVALTFSDCKGGDWATARGQMCSALAGACQAHGYLLDSPAVGGKTRETLEQVGMRMDDVTATTCLKALCEALEAHHGKRPVVLLDEYDTPMSEAWAGGWWDEAVSFQRSLFNSTFKACPALGRGLITGVTRVSRESIFSDLNNLAVVTTTTRAYQTSFGFTEAEVFDALEEFGLGGRRDEVKRLYDGFIFGGVRDIYNPWSITNYLKYQEPLTYWANTSGNGLVSSIVRKGDARLKEDFETLLKGGVLTKGIDEQVVFSELDTRPGAVWALLLAGGYLRALSHRIDPEFPGTTICELELTNAEVRSCFDTMVKGWFADGSSAYNDFIRALLMGETRMMTRFLGEVLLACASSFDGAKSVSERSEPERFYHGLVLGLLVELRGRYAVESNRESGFGRYDVMLVPNDGPGGSDPAIIIEFKLFDDYDEDSLADTVARARTQIEDKAYATTLVERGLRPERIHAYGIAFRGKKCLVG